MKSNQITYPIDCINPTEKTNPSASFAPAFRGQDQLIIYTFDYIYKTANNKTGTNPWGFEAGVNKEGIVISMSDRVVIPENGYVISGNSKAHDFITKNIELGTKVSIDEQNKILIVYVDKIASSLYNLKIKIEEIDTRVANAFNDIQLFNRKEVQIRLNDIHEAYQKLLNQPSLTEEECLKVKNEILDEITTIYCLTTSSNRIESRGVWYRPEEKNLSELLKTLNIMEECHLNTLYVESFYNGSIPGLSKITTTNEEVADGDYGPYGKDYLKALICEAHKRNIEVHAWVENFFVGEHIRFDKDYPQEFRMVNYNGSTIQGPGDGNSEIMENGFIFLDPANPKVHAYVLSIYEELLNQYEFDGFHIDYVRYPNGNLDLNTSNGYSQYAMNEFKAINQLPIDQDVRELVKDKDIHQKWIEYRCSKITLLVSEVYELVKRLRPTCKISMAVVPETDYAIKNKMQDWVTWVKNGWIDITLPMAYYFGTSEIEAATKNLVQFNDDKAFSYTGISPNYDGFPSIVNAYQIEACIQNKAQGYAIFSLPNITRSQSVQNVLKLGPNRHAAVSPHGDFKIILKTYVNELLEKLPYFEDNGDVLNKEQFLQSLKQFDHCFSLQQAMDTINAYLLEVKDYLKDQSYQSFKTQTNQLLTILKIQQYQATK